MDITPKMLKEIRKEINEALENVGKRHNLHLECANAKYSKTNFTMQLKGSVVNENGEVQSEAKINFLKEAAYYGLDPQDLGREFESRGEVFVICGLNVRARTMPILAYKKYDPSAKYKFSAEIVKRALSKDPKLSGIDVGSVPEHLRYLLK